MPLLNNVSTLVTPPPPDVQDEATPLRTIDDAVLVWIDDTIEWVGPAADCPSEYEDEPMHDAEGALVVPGLIDCHTHLAFGGWRADEFEMRLQGRSYLEIAKAGGGIASTMQETREASVDALYDRCRGFLDAMAGLKRKVDTGLRWRTNSSSSACTGCCRPISPWRSCSRFSAPTPSRRSMRTTAPGTRSSSATK